MTNIDTFSVERSGVVGVRSHAGNGNGKMPAALADAVRDRPLSELEDFFENGELALHLVGPNGSILRANKAELKMLGYTADEYIGRHIAEFHADQSTIEEILARLGRGEKLDKFPARLKAKDGSIKEVEITSSVHFEGDKFVHTRCFTTDVTELRRTQAALRAKDDQLKKVLEALPAAVYTTDKDGYITYFNPAAEAFAGRTPVLGAEQWCVTFRLRDNKGAPLPHEQCPMAIALKEQRPVRGVQAFAERPDGSVVPFQPYPTPLFDDNGELTGAVNMLVDISDQKAREKQIEFVMRELSHRSKNLLTIVQSVAMQTVRHSESFDDFQDKFMSRLHAMARMHDLLVANEWQGAKIQDIVRKEISAFMEDHSRVVAGGSEVSLNPSAAQSLSLAIHELATNAIKYGALSQETGTVHVSWDGANGSGIAFSWREEGNNPAAPTGRQGFGTHLLKAIFDKPQFDYSAGGLSFTGVLPYGRQ
jgi:PAS domain S-box-containing protein